MLSVSKHVKLLSTLFSLVNAGEKTFTLQFFHETRIDEIFLVPRFFDLHELQKNRGVFRTRVRNFGKNLQPKIIGLLENFWIGFALRLNERLPSGDLVDGILNAATDEIIERS